MWGVSLDLFSFNDIKWFLLLNLIFVTCQVVVEGMTQSQTLDPTDSNMLVVVPTKKKKEEALKPVVTKKKLSKKERKKLTDIVKRKEQKEKVCNF